MLRKNVILPIDLGMSSTVDKSTFSLCQLNRIERLGMDILQSMTSMLGFLGLILGLFDADIPSKDGIDRLRRLDP